MKIWKYGKRIGTGMIICGVCLNLSGCLTGAIVQEHLPEETIEAYEDAINSMDVDGMMACMDESTQKTMTAGLDVTMGIVGAVTGFDLGISAEDLISLMPFFTAVAGEYGTDVYPQVDFQVTRTLIQGDKATVYFDEVNSGQSQVINMVKESGKWYMTMDVVLISEEEAERILYPGQEEETQENDLGGLGDLSLEDLVKIPLDELFDLEKIQDFLDLLP